MRTITTALLGVCLLVFALAADAGVPAQGSARRRSGAGHRAPEAVTVLEAGLKFTAPLADGQKTGWFYDQTANRAWLRQRLRPGARVLDVCSYVGAWAVSAMAAARPMHCAWTPRRRRWTGRSAMPRPTASALAVQKGDAFDVLESLHAQGERFDVVVVDPPAFIKRRKDLPQGEAAYRKLNQLALRLAAPEALLVSCSCSYHLPAESLRCCCRRRPAHERPPADPRQRRPVAGPSGASGHARNALSQGLLLPRSR